MPFDDTINTIKTKTNKTPQTRTDGYYLIYYLLHVGCINMANIPQNFCIRIINDQMSRTTRLRYPPTANLRLKIFVLLFFLTFTVISFLTFKP